MKSLLPELIVRFSINNQVTIGLQNVYRKPSDFHQPIGENANKYKIASFKHSQKNQVGDRQNDETFGDRLNRLYPLLDITKKSQRSKKVSILRKGFSKILGTDKADERIPPFGAKQGQKLRESGAAIDLLMTQQGGAARIITLTLVGDTKEAFECLAANSGYAINRLFQSVRRNAPDCKNWFFVWEYQKRGALHLHICLWHEKPNMAARLGVKIVQSWYKILQDIQSQTGIDMFIRRDRKTYTPKRKWQSRNEPMRKSAGGYFSKYASKASNKEERKYIYHLAQKYPPSRFWGSSQSVKNIIKENSFSYSFESWKTEASNEYCEGLRELLSQFDILDYGVFEFKVEKEWHDRKGNERGKRVISEGFRQNYYFESNLFNNVKQAVMLYLGAMSHHETSMD